MLESLWGYSANNGDSQHQSEPEDSSETSFQSLGSNYSSPTEEPIIVSAPSTTEEPTPEMEATSQSYMSEDSQSSSSDEEVQSDESYDLNEAVKDICAHVGPRARKQLSKQQQQPAESQNRHGGGRPKTDLQIYIDKSLDKIRGIKLKQKEANAKTWANDEERKVVMRERRVLRNQISAQVSRLKTRIREEAPETLV